MGEIKDVCAPNSILSKVSGTYQVSVKFFSLHGISEFTSPGKVFNIPIIYEKYCLLMLCHTLLTSLCALLAHPRALTDSYCNCPHYADVKTKALTKSNSCSVASISQVRISLLLMLPQNKYPVLSGSFLAQNNLLYRNCVP